MVIACQSDPVSFLHLHSHEVGHKPDPQRTPLLLLSTVLLFLLSGTELAVSLWSHSLALLADSGHMVADGLALGLALWASWLAAKPATETSTFGYRRAEIVVAFLNGLLLLGMSGWLGWEAVVSWQHPPQEILSLPMLLMAGVSLAVNGLNALLLHPHSHQDLNLQAVFLHLLGDALSSLGLMVAALAIWRWNWVWMDSGVSLITAGFIGLNALPLIQQSLRILLQQTPERIRVQDVQILLQSFPGVVQIDSLRLWTMAVGQHVLTAHILMAEGLSATERDAALQQMQEQLRDRFGLEEITLQLSSHPWHPDPTCESCPQPEQLFPSLREVMSL